MTELAFTELATKTSGFLLSSDEDGSLIMQNPDNIYSALESDLFLTAVGDFLAARPKRLWRKPSRVDFPGGAFEFHLRVPLKESHKRRLVNNQRDYFYPVVHMDPGFSFHTPSVVAALAEATKLQGLAPGDYAYAIRFEAGAGYGHGRRAIAGLVDLKRLRRPWFIGSGGDGNALEYDQLISEDEARRIYHI